MKPLKHYLTNLKAWYWRTIKYRSHVFKVLFLKDQFRLFEVIRAGKYTEIIYLGKEKYIPYHITKKPLN